MGKPTLKGGTWTNVEDEILKVAVMKYGRHQWARISSLLVRKTAKQCKARWLEWLEPTIKKTEWSRDEEERLLHLAKVMPCQWKSIAPIVGRTAAQCQEKYEELLEKAVMATSQTGENGSGIGLKEGKKLLPGEIDSLPEVKPARPDPVDMDEEEKEMLSEARARLANTQGKKAKRKARHRILEEARRQSTMQKRKELQEAGLPVMPGGRGYHRQLKLTNYNEEIPFERRPLPGFYDVSTELTEDQKEFKKREAELKIQGNDRPLTLTRDAQDLEDLKKEEQRDKERLDKGFLPVNLERKLRQQQSLRRGMLNLPTPQISESELELIAKVSHSNESALLLAGDQTPATSLLLSNTRTATATPLRKFGEFTPKLGDPSATPGSSRGLAEPSEEIALRKRRLQTAFSKLPAPSNNYEVVISSEEDDVISNRSE
jgi:pre-mRNA-splicing factor CDC5/CEF1